MSNQKRGFRLPWAADRDPDGSVQTAEADGSTPDPLVTGDAREAHPNQDESTDAVPAASDAPEVSAEAEMFDTETPAAPSANGARPEEATWGTAWPSSDRAPATQEGDAVPRTDFGAPADTGSLAALESLEDASTTDPHGRTDGQSSDNRADKAVRPPIRVASEPRAGRRENPLVAGLVKAMREAAVASREETTKRLQAEATARTEEIRAAATDEAAAIRKQVEDDVAGIREWSKAEMARIRQQTEERIESRKADAVDETKRHEDEVERRVGAVQATVSAFETEMASFFDQLLAENDPARLAALAEQAPEPPDLTFEGPVAESSNGEAASPLEATAAAEAEAEATEGLDLAQSNEWPAAVLAARLGAVAAPESASDSPHTSQLMVSGLASVAAISAFKGAVGQLPGVESVSVTSGEKGMFIFNVGHGPGVDLGPAVASLSGFVVAIIDATDDSYTITVHEAAA